MNNEDAEKYAILALIRHYWKKGLSAEGAVREICAVEGVHADVDIEMAQHWFNQFESGHTQLVPKKTIWLPSETWEEVFKFMPFSDLHQHMPTTCRRFWALTEPVMNRLCPRVAKRIKICWESEECLRRFERGNEIDANAATDLDLHSLEQLSNGNLLKWEWGSVPCDQPPPNIIGFQQIIIQGQLDRQLLALLYALSTRITDCQLDFNDLDNFMSALASQHISLVDFFVPFSRCSHMILYRHIPDEFLACPVVLHCPSIEMHWLEFNPATVLHWLLTTSPVTAKKSLTIYGYYCGANETEPINVLLATLISEYRQDSTTALRPNLVMDLCDFDELYLTEFVDERIMLVRMSETNWRLTCLADSNDNDHDDVDDQQQNIDQQQQWNDEETETDHNEKTLIEICRFFN